MVLPGLGSRDPRTLFMIAVLSVLLDPVGREHLRRNQPVTAERTLATASAIFYDRETMLLG
jgi:hypothetical protein